MAVKYDNSKLMSLPLQWRNRISLELNSANSSQVSVAKQLAPRDTNYMADISTRVIQEASPDSLRAVSEVGAEYGVYQEFGTVDIDAQPFWTPSFKLARAQLLNALRGLLNRSSIRVNYGVSTLTNPDTFVSR